jgi:hypothetical protein
MAPEALDTGFAIRLGGTTILSHAAGAPCIAVGRGRRMLPRAGGISMFRRAMSNGSR